MIGQLSDSQIRLKKIFIENQLPPALEPLRRLAYNLWWSWHKDASELFRSIDQELFIRLNYNPVALLDNLDSATINRLADDEDFLQRLSVIDQTFQAYLNEPRTADQPKIAYFCMEYGLHISLRLYSGGLGVLAGDYLKEASDSNSEMVAVGLLYRYGYFTQSVALNGDQIHNFPAQEFTKLPVSPVRNDQGEWMKIHITLLGRIVTAKIWKLQVGRVPLYLLDTDIEENSWEDRTLTHQLYGGDNEHRLKQEILLGIGGIRALQAMGIEAELYHCNEGHAAFLGLERLRTYLNRGFTYEESTEIVRSSALYTTHTPVPAGHDHFPEHLMRSYLQSTADELGIAWEDFMALGRKQPDDAQEDFSMSNLAIRLSQEVNGVSKLHGTVSQKMFNELYPGYNSEELHIGYVTNSVHYPTWIAPELNKLYVRNFGDAFLKDQSNPDHWRKIHQVDNAELVEIRKGQKKKLLAYVRDKLQEDLTRRGENPRAIFEILNGIEENALIFGFARRFATYKRAHLLFSNLDRLRTLVNDPERPIMFLYAGKAHPADGGGQDLIRHIIHISKQPDFQGKVIFLENYNMEMAKLLYRGVDVWLNTPTRPLEASGTSGMKASLNGTVNFSVLDGWWAEGYRPDAGWALPLDRTYDDQNLQNELDAETIYNIIEDEIAATYFDRDEQGIPQKWMEYVKNNLAEVAPHFTMKRMLDDYYDRFYNKLYRQTKQIRQNNYEPARELTVWKRMVEEKWPGLHSLHVDTIDAANHSLPLGQKFQATVRLDLNGLSPNDIGMEVAFFKRLSESELELKFAEPFQMEYTDGNQATFRVSVDPHLVGVYEYGFRAYPKHPLLANRQDLNLVYWA